MNQYPIHTKICDLLRSLLSQIEATQSTFCFTTHMDPEFESEALATDDLSVYVGKHEGDHFTLWVPVSLYAWNIVINDASEVTPTYVGRFFLDALESNADAAKNDETYAGDYAVLEEALEVIRPIIEEQYLSTAVTDGVSVTTSRIKI